MLQRPESTSDLDWAHPPKFAPQAHVCLKLVSEVYAITLIIWQKIFLFMSVSRDSSQVCRAAAEIASAAVITIVFTFLGDRAEKRSRFLANMKDVIEKLPYFSYSFRGNYSFDQQSYFLLLCN